MCPEYTEVAERVGFEPTVRCYPYNGLASRRYRPLSHLSSRVVCVGEGRTSPDTCEKLRYLEGLRQGVSFCGVGVFS